MQFDDEKIDIKCYEKMAKAYYDSLEKNNIKFVRINNNQQEKQKIENKISEKFSYLFFHTKMLEKTRKTKNIFFHTSNILQNIDFCKTTIQTTNIYPLRTNNLFRISQNMICACAELISLCQDLSVYNTSQDTKTLCKCFSNIIVHSSAICCECF